MNKDNLVGAPGTRTAGTSHVIIRRQSGLRALEARRMRMEISTKAFKHCHLVTVKGRVDSATAPQLSSALDGLIEKGEYKIVIDMSSLEYMSSAGFRALLAAQRQCKRYNRGEVLLAAVPTRIREALELAGFTELFKTYAEPLEAVGSI